MEATEWIRSLAGLLPALISITAFLIQPIPSRAQYLQSAIAFTLFALMQLSLSLKLFVGIWTGAWMISLILAVWEGHFTHRNSPSWPTFFMVALMPLLLVIYILTSRSSFESR